MNKDIKSLLIRTFGTITYLVVIFFFVTLILFTHNNVESSLKESWTASLSFASMLATIGAAIIAANIFNHWHDQYLQEKLDKNIETISNTCNDVNNYFLYDFHHKMMKIKDENKKELSKFITIKNDKEIDAINHTIDLQVQSVLKTITIFSTILNCSNQQLISSKTISDETRDLISTVILKIVEIRKEISDYKNEIRCTSLTKKWGIYASQDTFELKWKNLVDDVRITEIVCISSDIPIKLILENSVNGEIKANT